MESNALATTEVESEEVNRTFVELNEEISVSTVSPIIAILDAAKPGDSIALHMRNNNGGDVGQLFELIKALVRTKATVEISFGRFIMSAAASLWLWFWLRPAPHVKSLLPRKPAVIMYHRPRRPHAESYYCFAEDFEEGDPIRESLMELVRVFDKLFEELLERMGWSALTSANVVSGGVIYQHSLQHLKDAYYGNKDCIIPV